MVLVMAERQAPLTDLEIAQKVRDRQEGFTVHPYSGRTPKSGYQVAVQGRTEFHPASVLDDTQALSDKLYEHRERNRDLYRRGGRHYVGGWRAPHPETGADTLWLEPSEHVKTRHRAVSLGVERNQIEVWDNVRENSIATGGTGLEKEGSSPVPRQLGRTDRRPEASSELRDGEDHPEGVGRGQAQGVTHAGLALTARDTGRVLCLQRALDPDDPAGGKFEFPGGRVEDGESPIEGAIREWKEETGCPLPEGQVADSWLSGGMYRGFVYVVPSEDVLAINGSPEDRQVLNPDDPDGDHIEVVLWMSPKDLKENKAVRKEVRNGTDWSVFSKALRKAAIAVAVADKPPCECGHPQSEHSRGRGTCDSCWSNFMEHFQDWYKGTGPEVTYCKRYKGDRAKIAMSDRSEYGMQHSPNDDGPPVHALNTGYGPEDIYTHMRHYRTGDDRSDAESMAAIEKAHGGDGEHSVTIYRSAPEGVKTFNHGDWVTLSPHYAHQNGLHPTDEDKDMPTYKAEVKAKHVRWPADSINEFGYFGPEVPTTVHRPGGPNAPRTGPSPKEGSMKVSLASDEIVVPRNIDTLRDSECAVCGSVGTMNGDRCTVCGYMATPQAFQSPDLSLAPKVRDQLGIGNPEGDDALGAPDAGLEGPPGAEGDLDAMGEGGEGLDGPVGAEGDLDALDGAEEPEDAPSLVCDNCGTTFDSEDQEQDLSEPYLSPAARIEPDVSALGVNDDMEVAREIGQEDNATGATEGVAHQEGEECPVCGVGTLVPNDEPGPNELDGDAVGGVPEDEEGMPGDEEELPGEEEGAPGEEVPPGEEAPPGEEEGPDGGEEAPPEAEGEEEGQGPPVEGDEDEEPEEDDEDDQEDEDDGPPFGRRQRKESSTMADLSGARPPVPRGRTTQRQPPRQATAAAPNPAALERRRLFQALEATTASLNRQADLLQAQDRKLNSVGKFMRQASTKISELNLRNETLERQMALVANASGLVEPLATIGAAGQNRVAALYGRTANPANPAQPVPDPPSEPPVVTSEEARQSAGRDDVTQLGATPVSDVAADGVTSVDVPYGEIANQPVGVNRTDVTAPVQGTESATPPEMTVIPVDTRIGNPDNPQVAFPFTVGPVGSPGRPYSGPSVGNPPSTAARNDQRREGEPGVAVHPQAQAHYIAAVNLARLRAQVGISNEEPFELGGKIASSMSDAQINAEAQGLQAVAARLSRQASGPAPFQPGPAFAPVEASDGRPMVPHMASAPGGTVLPPDPSFQSGKYGPGPGSTIQGTTMFAPRSEEFGWDSPV